MTPVLPFPETVVQGDDWRFCVDWTDPSNRPIDARGYKIEASIVWPNGSLECTVDNRRVSITDSLNGKWEILIRSADTMAVPKVTYVSDPWVIPRLSCWVTDPNGLTNTIFEVLLRVITR